MGALGINAGSRSDSGWLITTVFRYSSGISCGAEMNRAIAPLRLNLAASLASWQIEPLRWRKGRVFPDVYCHLRVSVFPERRTQPAMPIYGQLHSQGASRCIKGVLMNLVQAKLLPVRVKRLIGVSAGMWEKSAQGRGGQRKRFAPVLSNMVHDSGRICRKHAVEKQK